MSSQLAISQAIDALIRSGKEEGDPLTLPAFQQLDIYPMFEHAFSDKAKKTMSLKTDSLLHQYNEPLDSAYILTMLGNLGLKTCARYKGLNPVDMYIRKTDLIHFVASRAIKDKLPIAINKVIATVNDVADNGFTKVCLVQLSVIETVPIDLPEPEFIVISYISLTEKGSQYVVQNWPDMFIPEGGIPQRVK